MPQSQQCQIPAASVTYAAAFGSAGSLPHWTRPGVKPASSWLLVGFVSTTPQWELPFFFFSCFLGPHLQHMEVPRLGVKSELQLLAYATATATADPSCICDLYHSLRQCWILNPLSEARDWTPTSSWMPLGFINHWATMGTPANIF